MAGTIWPSLVAGARAKASEVEQKFDWIEGDLVPMTGGIKTAGTYALGTDSFTWTNAFFSGRVYTGVGSSANNSVSLRADKSTGINFDSSLQISNNIGGSTVMQIQVSQIQFGTTTSLIMGASGQIQAANGTATLPSLSFLTDTSMGRYLVGAGEMADVDNGTEWTHYHPDGHTTKVNQAGFLAHWNATSTTLNVDGTDETLTASWAELYDQNADFATGVFTAPITGRYLLNFVAKMQITDPLASNTFSVITTSRRYQAENSSGGVVATVEAHNNHTSFSAVVPMTSGDTAHVVHLGSKNTTTAAAFLRGFESSSNGGGTATFWSMSLLM